jgi:hypothetical protein
MSRLVWDRSLSIGCRICWRMICTKHEMSIQKRYSHSSVLSNVIVGIILWPVMSRVFSFDYHVACRLYREMTRPHSRDLIFRAKNSWSQSCGTRTASILLKDSQMTSKRRALILWQISLLHLNKRCLLEERRWIRNDLWFILTIAQFMQVGLQQIGSKNIAWAIGHTHPIRLIWPRVTSAFFYRKRKTWMDSGGRRGPVFSSTCKRFWELSIKKDWIAYFGLWGGGFKTWAKGMEITSDDKYFSCILVLNESALRAQGSCDFIHKNEERRLPRVAFRDVRAAEGSRANLFFGSSASNHISE